MITRIFNGNILTPSGEWLNGGSIIICNGKITEVNNGDSPDCRTDESIDAQGGYIVPGGIDLHIHGGAGHDFMEGTHEAFEAIIATHRRHGTTSILPTLASSSPEQIERAAATCTDMMNDPTSGVLGLHLEGPYFQPSMAGGQIPENIRLPHADEYVALTQRFPCIKRWDAAPELPGALDFGRYVSARGIIAGIAHTKAGYAEVSQALEAGYNFATHFYNAMTTIHKEGIYKHEGTVEAIYLSDGIDVELIADGIHVPAPLLKMAYKIKGPDHICLITDAAVTESDGGSAVDPRVIIEDGVCKLSDRSAIAGSCATMDRLVRTMALQAGIPLADVFKMTSSTPARILGVDDRKGTLAPGKDADICIYDPNLILTHVISMGQTHKP